MLLMMMKSLPIKLAYTRPPEKNHLMQDLGFTENQTHHIAFPIARMITTGAED